MSDEANAKLKTLPTMDDLLEEFEELESWEDRCELLIDLGFDLPEFPEAERTELNRVHGCQSNVWMVLRKAIDDSRAIEIVADSDSMLVRGLIAVLLAVYSGKTAKEILEADVRRIFARIGLDRHLSPARRNGVNGMVQRIQDFAREAV